MNTRLSVIFSSIVLTGLLLAACGISVIQGSGRIRTESRDVRDFSAVDFPGAGELTVIQGETEGLTIEADDNLLPYIKGTISRGTLTLGFIDDAPLRFPRPSRPIRYTLNVKTLTGLELSGAGVVFAERLTADRLTLAQSGAGDISIDELMAGGLTVDMSGAGTVKLAGEVTSQSVDMSGLGNYQADDLESQNAKLMLSGAGSATVWVHESLDADLSGAGTIRYYGTPQASTSISGAGKIESLGDK